MKSLYFDSFRAFYSRRRSNFIRFFDLFLSNPTSDVVGLAPSLLRNTSSSRVLPLGRLTVNVDLRTSSKWGTTVPSCRSSFSCSSGAVAWHSSTLFASSRFVLRPPDTRRHRHRGGDKRGRGANERTEGDEEEDDDEEEEEEEDADLSHLTYLQDQGFPDNYKQVKIHMKSLRLDAIVSGGLNIARKKADDYFLESKLKLNGERVLKKSKQVKIGDYIDLVMAAEEGKQKVKRVRILKVDSDRTATDKLKVTVRAWRTAVSVNA